MMHFSATKALSFVLLISTTCTVHGQLINEYQPNPPGGDPSNVQVELKGTPGQSFTGCFISIECDLLTFAGNVDRIAEVSGTFDSNGLLVDTIPDLENPSHIAVLLDASCASLVASTSLSTGSPASSFSLPALDAIGVPDSAGDVSNCIPSNHISGFSGGNHFAYTGDEPRLVFRDGNTNDWYAINDPDRGVVYDINGASHDPSEFDTDPTAGTDTFGQKNPSTTTSAPTDVSAGGNGDPHFKTWNGTWFDFHGICDLVLIQDDSFANGLGLTIHIRTKGRYQYAYIESASIKIGDDVLEFGSWGEHFFNGVEVLADEMPASISSLGFPGFYKMKDAKTHFFKITLDKKNQEAIVVKSFKDMVSVNVENATVANFGSSAGLLGSFVTGSMVGRDGTSVFDDMDAFGQEWQVLPSEPQLFQTPSNYVGEACVPPTAQGRRRLGEAIPMEAAEEACSHHNDADLKDMCIFDVIAMNDLEVANAHGAF